MADYDYEKMAKEAAARLTDEDKVELLICIGVVDINTGDVADRYRGVIELKASSKALAEKLCRRLKEK